MAPQKKAKLVCAICQNGATQTCPNCNIVHYCSDEHQRRHHRSGHGIRCRPTKSEKLDRGWEKLIATRDIKQGETVFRQKPIFIGPGYSEFYFLEDVPVMAICLGCYREVLTENRCSKCKWPVCCKKCENEPWHKNFECKVLTKRKIPFRIENKERYYHITLLRLLLLKHKKSEIWEKLLVKIDFYIKNSKSEYFIENAKYVGKTLRKDFHTCNMNLDIGKIQGVIRMLDSHGITGQNSDDMAATCLFDSTFKIPFDCTPNTYSFLRRTPEGEPKLDIWAVLPIPTGENITRNHNRYISVSGNADRRLRLLEHYEYICKCRRCSDKTELGSNFSSFKCQVKNCPGYVLPKTPLTASMTSLWNCNTCPKPRNISYAELRQNFDKRLDIMCARILTKTNGQWCGRIEKNENVFARIKRLDTVLQLSKTEVHPNHHSLWVLKESYMQDLVELMEVFCGPRDEQIIMARRLLQFATDYLLLSNIVVPGFTAYRGRILYFVTKASRYLIDFQPANERNAYVQGNVDRMENLALEILKKYYGNYIFAGEEVIRMIDDLEMSSQLAICEGIVNLFLEDE